MGLHAENKNSPATVWWYVGRNQVVKTRDVDSKKSGRSTFRRAIVVRRDERLSHSGPACLVLDAAILVADPPAIGAMSVVGPVQGPEVTPSAVPLLLLDIFGPARGTPTVAVAAKVDIVLAGAAAVGVTRRGRHVGRLWLGRPRGDFEW